MKINRIVAHAAILGCSLISQLLLAQSAPDIGRLLADPGTIERFRVLTWTGAGDSFETAQTVVAGSRGRHVSTYRVEGRWEPGTGANYSWSLHTHYPFPADWAYTEALVGGGGTGSFQGVDGFRPTPPGDLPLARGAARAKLLWMSHPALLLSQAQDVVEVMGRVDAVSFSAVNTRWTVQLDRATGYPLRISTTEADPIFGAVGVSMDYFAWTQVQGILMPGQLEYRVDGQLIRREERDALDIVLASSGEARRFSPSLDKARFAKGWTTAHWFLRRIAMGASADNDESRPVELLEVADRVYQALGSSHHSLIIESEDSLTVVDAPLYPERSEAVLEALRERWPDKPVARLILTHHHYDHSGGVLTYAAAGIPITVHASNREFFVAALSGQGIGSPQIESVGEQAKITVGGRLIGLYDIPTTHAAGILGVYVPDQALFFNADLYSPGRETQHPLWSSELLQAIRFLGLPVELLVGGHGRGSQPLDDLVRAAGAP